MREFQGEKGEGIYKVIIILILIYSMVGLERRSVEEGF
jgi:hypothetical protein